MDKVQPPLVSCILPTYNRRPFILNAIRYFQRQDYAAKELIILDDGTDAIGDLVPKAKNIRYYRLDEKITLGAKLNLACTYASGEIIANWDDDDWYAPRRLSYQMEAMQQKGVAVCGINKLLYLDLRSKQAYQYIYPANQKVWLIGSSLCFTKELWASIRFADINVGMDGLFVWATPPNRIKVLEDHTFAVHTIHDHNISPKQTNGAWWHSHPVEDLQRILQDDWKFYANGHHTRNLRIKSAPRTGAPVDNGVKTVKNVYACLVHESEECILDLVRNLRYHDPDSVILLYNGSNNPNLIAPHFPVAQYGVVLHPHPQPQKHGYLHHFALDCMAFALEHLSFDVLTIVDSDQLAVRSGYTQFIAPFLASGRKIGMFSSLPERVTADQKHRLVPLRAWQELALWKPFLQKFPDGENQFVHWTFWPSTVFTHAAIRDLVRLFREDEMLQSIMQQSRIWATEEVVFPTLVKLLGYEIIANPCSCDFVQYRKAYTLPEVGQALQQTGVYWMHPIERRPEQALRKHIRDHCHDYYQQDRPANGSLQAFPAASLVRQIKRIEGWLSDEEASLLVAITLKALHTLPPPHQIVEVGSYHGKSTVLLGSVAKAVTPPAKVCAIDPHNGQLGAADQGLQSFPPSLGHFQKNIGDAGLADVVDIMVDHPCNVAWSTPIALLFMDGLHDYENVGRDFRQFSDWLRPGGYVAFHDYADYYPGVKKLVNELLQTGKYQKAAQVQSMMVLQCIAS